jgi:ketosteroid isomerase-like protein
MEQGVEKAIVTWTPDFIDVSQDGSMAYTYGKYLWKIPDSDSTFVDIQRCISYGLEKTNRW